MNQLTKVNPAEFGLNEETALTITKGLTQIIEERALLTEQYKEVITLDIDEPTTTKRASELRKAIKDNRTKGIVVWHKTNKEFYLRGGQFVDAIKNKEIVENERMEEMLEKIEKHAEIKEANRIKQLQFDRQNECAPYAEFIPQGLNLGAILDDDYNKLLEGAKLQMQAKIDRETKEAAERAELARKAEEERIEKERIAAEERARIEAENARLKAEAEAKEKQLAAERAEAAKKQAEIEAKAKAEREAAAKKAEEERAKQEAILKAEREAKEKLEAELKAKQEAEARAKAEAEAAAQAALAASDKDKLVALGKTLTAIVMPEVKSKKAQAIINELKANLDASIAKFRQDFTNQYK